MVNAGEMHLGLPQRLRPIAMAHWSTHQKLLRIHKAPLLKLRKSIKHLLPHKPPHKLTRPVCLVHQLQHLRLPLHQPQLPLQCHPK